MYLQNNDIVKLPSNFGPCTTTLFSLYLANGITNSQIQYIQRNMHTVFAVLCCGYTLTDFPISIRLTSLALRQSNDCPSASKATVMNMDKYFMWIHYERLHDHNKAKHNKTMCIFLGIYCIDLSVFGAFTGLRVLLLTGLDIGNIRVTLLPPNAHVLHLTHGKMGSFPFLSQWVPNIIEFVLRSYQLQTIPQKGVAGLYQLKCFDDSHNKIDNIPNFSHCKQLKGIN